MYITKYLLNYLVRVNTCIENISSYRFRPGNQTHTISDPRFGYNTITSRKNIQIKVSTVAIYRPYQTRVGQELSDSGLKIDTMLFGCDDVASGIRISNASFILVPGAPKDKSQRRVSRDPCPGQPLINGLDLWNIGNLKNADVFWGFSFSSGDDIIIADRKYTVGWNENCEINSVNKGSDSEASHSINMRGVLHYSSKCVSSEVSPVQNHCHWLQVPFVKKIYLRDPQKIDIPMISRDDSVENQSRLYQSVVRIVLNIHLLVFTCVHPWYDHTRETHDVVP